jgi:hypothetical protein
MLGNIPFVEMNDFSKLINYSTDMCGGRGGKLTRDSNENQQPKLHNSLLDSFPSVFGT